MKTSIPIKTSRFRGALFTLALLAFAPATLTLAAQPSPTDGAGADKFSSNLSGCLERGGAVTRGPFGETYCRIPYPDGGKACTDGSQCRGNCIYSPRSGPMKPPEGPVVGACQRANVQFGCFGIVQNGRAGRFICVD